MRATLKTSLIFTALFSALTFCGVEVASAQVWEEWVAIYDPDPYGAGPEDIAVDAEGNVYVTGATAYSWMYSDYVTIKYNAEGVVQWVATYNGPAGNGQDISHALVLDDSGNVYVTGESGDFSQMSTYDIVTIKYSSAGEELWVERYDGPANNEDVGRDIALGADGNIYVTGYSRGDSTLSSRNYVTLKYDPTGVLQWAATYNGPANDQDKAVAIDVDDSNNVYVTGYVTSTYYTDIGTVKYNSDGVQQWVALYNNPANNGYDKAVDLGLDASGNVYVAGFTDMRYGYVYNWDYVTIKYNSDGVEQWVNLFDGPGGEWDEARALAVDADGNVLVTGFALVNLSVWKDYATVKYNSEGVQQWVAYYNGLGNLEDYPYDIAVDNLGNAYVTGYSPQTPSPGRDFATVKYDSSGVEQWVATYDGPYNLFDEGKCITVDDNGNVYVSGTCSTDEPFVYEMATIKYNQTGPAVPVILSSFYAEPAAAGVVLHWSTASQIDCYGWKVQRSQDKSTYFEISALLPAEGSGAESREYSFTDNNITAGRTYSYRIEQVKLDGSLTFSQPITLTYEPPLASQYDLLSVYPNPFNSSTKMSLLLPQACPVNLSVYDISGTLVRTLIDGWQEAGNYELTLDGTGLASGVYLYQLHAGDFSVKGKLVLMK